MFIRVTSLRSSHIYIWINLLKNPSLLPQLVCSRDAAGDDGELDRIQELFPHDALRLHDTHPTSQVSRFSRLVNTKYWEQLHMRKFTY